MDQFDAAILANVVVVAHCLMTLQHYSHQLQNMRACQFWRISTFINWLLINVCQPCMSYWIVQSFGYWPAFN